MEPDPEKKLDNGQNQKMLKKFVSLPHLLDIIGDLTELHSNICYKNRKKVQCHKPFNGVKSRKMPLKQASSPPVSASEANRKKMHGFQKKKRYHPEK